MTYFAQIEQELARRVGPYYQDNAGLGATPTTAALPTLASTLALGDQWTGLYARRRGFLINDPTTLLNTFRGAGDDVRRVAKPIDANGVLTVDRAWATSPVPAETIELHYLDPLAELRIAALAGLQRCYTVDRAQIITSGAAAERDVTAVAPWITRPGQIYEVAWTYPGLIYVPRPVPYWREFMQDGHLWLAVWPDPWPNTLLVSARRPVGTQTNQAAIDQVAPVTIVGASNTTPIVLTTTGFSGWFVAGSGANRWVLVQGVLGNTAANGAWKVGAFASPTMTLLGSQGNGAYLSGGTVTALSYVTPTDPHPQVNYLPGSIDSVDDVPVSVAYAAAAGHVEAWRLFPDRFSGGAAAGVKSTLEQAAAAFTEQAIANFQPLPKREQLASPFPAWSVQRP